MYLHCTFLFEMLFIFCVSVSVFHYSTNNTKPFSWEFSDVKNIIKEALVVDCKCHGLCGVMFSHVCLGTVWGIFNSSHSPNTQIDRRCGCECESEWLSVSLC